MEILTTLVLLVILPVIFFPAALTWYLNFGSIYTAITRQEGKSTLYKK